MRKINFLKTVLGVAVAIMASTSAFGQIPANYVAYDPAAAAPNDIDYVTVGKSMGYYTLPDPVYSPTYTVDGTIGTGLTWIWTNTVNPGTAATLAYPGAANYARITYPVVGNYTITSVEHTPAAFGGCDGSTRTLNVTAVDAPTAEFTTADILTGLCGNQAAQSCVLAITEDVPVAIAGYSFVVTESIDNINAAGVVTANVSTNATFVNFPLAAKLKSTTSGWGGAQPDYTYTFNSSALAVQNSLRTRYTYTLASAAGVTGTGIVSAISQKSDFLNAPASVTGYAFGGKTTVVFIVNPAPVTGPIYYVPNTLNY